MNYINSYLGKNFIHAFIFSVVTSNSNDVMKVDSGSSKVYLKEIHRLHLKKLKDFLHGTEANLTNIESIIASA